jgi:hypothetical protein
MPIACRGIVLSSYLAFGAVIRMPRGRGESGFIVGRVGFLIMLLGWLGGLER